MKTSFYFVLWFISYMLIIFFGTSWMLENSFFVALVVVWIAGIWVNKITVSQRAYIARRNVVAFCELIYQNDLYRILAASRKSLLFSIASVIYFIIAIVFLLTIHCEFMIIAIFVLCAILEIRKMYASYKTHISVRNTGEIEMTPEALDMYELYKAERDAGRTALQMYPQPTWKDKLMRGCNYGFAILSMLIGLFYLGIALLTVIRSTNIHMTGTAMTVAYGSLAFIYGLNDLVSTINYNKYLN